MHFDSGVDAFELAEVSGMCLESRSIAMLCITLAGRYTETQISLWLAFTL
jgi:hypothetical protein